MAQTVPFENATLDRIIWVSPTGDDNNNGARDAPLKSIQLAIDRAEPGTAILLQPGDYTGNFEFQAVQGREESPIWLAAAEGRGTVTITAASSASPVISFFGEDNLVIRDLTLVGGSNTIQAGQSGNNYTDFVNNIVVQGNTITGSAKDGIKISQGVNVHVIENTVSNVGEEGVDFLGVRQSQISGNEISNVTGTSAALFAKGGSSDILISNNYIHDVGPDGILVGGWTGANSFLPGTDYEAKNVEVSDNVVEHAGKRPLAVLGGQDVDIHDNLIGSSPENEVVVYVGAGSPHVSPRPPSMNVAIHDNAFDRADHFARVEPTSSDVAFFNNDQDGVVEGDMRTSPPDPSPDPLSETWPDALLDAPVLWQTSARSYNTIKGTSGPDELTGTDGHDFIPGGGNADTMTGRRGDDVYDVSSWKDVITENPDEGVDTARVYADTATLPANVENLTVRTGAGGTFAGNDLNNIMTAGRGNDALSGGGGDDLFVPSPNASQDTITDFVPGDGGRDTIDVRAFTEFDDFSDVLARSQQVGTDTKISFSSGGSVTLSNVAMTDLADEDFLFREPPQEPDEPGDNAPTDLTLSTAEIVEGADEGAVVGALAAVDPDANDTFTYSLIDDAGGLFAIDGANLVAAGTLDYETATHQQVNARVTDSAGHTFDKTFTIAIGNASPAAPADVAAEPNEVTEGAANGTPVGITAAASDPAGGAVSYALLDDADGRFAIDALTGVVTVANGDLFDFEAASEHSIVVRASDPSGANSTETFKIGVVNAAPSIPTDSETRPNYVEEGAANGKAVGIVASATDAGGGTVSYALSDDADGRFAIDPATGVVTVANGDLLDFEEAREHAIVVEASDPSGATSTAAMTIAVADALPSSPVDTETEANAVREGAASGSTVGVTALSMEGGDGDVRYAMVEDASGRFAIDPTTGVVTVAAGNLIDYEIEQSHAVTVSAEAGGLSATADFTIDVTNIDPATINGTSDADIVDADRTIAGQRPPTVEADTIYGKEGDDQLSGLLGNDFIDGGEGVDTMLGGSGADTYVVDRGIDVVIADPDSGIDTVLASTKYTLPDNVENLTMTGGTRMRGIGNSLDNVMIGNTDNNALVGLEGADRLDGGPSGTDTADYSDSDAAVSVSLMTRRGSGGHAEGDRLTGIDNITGSAYGDTLEGGAGTNILRGGDGNDTVTYEHAKRGVTVTLATTEQQTTGGAGLDRLYAIENLTGSEFDDVLGGSRGANVLLGLGGNDTLNGGEGNDALDGGDGEDTLTGGAGSDYFLFGDPSGGLDTLTDFMSQEDFLKIVAADFSETLQAGATATLITAEDVASAGGPGDGGYFVFDNAGDDAGTLYWNGGGEDDEALAFARLHGTTSLLSSDFLIV